MRSDNPVIMSLLEAGLRGSITFRRLIVDIGRTDGLVYVEPGTCPGYRIKGCVLHTMSATGGSRYLWIAIELSDTRINLMVRLAHEIRHTLEILSDSSIRTGDGIFAFYHPEGIPPTRAFETDAAFATGAAVRRELTHAGTSESHGR